MSSTKSRITFFLLACLFLIPLNISAQGVLPTNTPIPITGAEDTGSAAPGLPGGAPTVPDTSTNTVTDPTPVPSDDVASDEGTDSAAPASSGDTCPTLVQESFTATEEFACADVGAGQSCIGNGTVEATLRTDDASFSNPADTISTTNIEQLTLRSVGTPDNVWTVVTGSVSLNSVGSGSRVTQLVLFGDVSLTDQGEIAEDSAIRNGEIIAQRGLNVRRTPENSGVVVWQLGAGEQVQVTGITPDRQWTRIVIPGPFGGIGWIYSVYVNVPGGVDSLPTVTAASPPPDTSGTGPEFGPMQAITFQSAEAQPGCGTDIPDSGALIQSPSGLPDAVRMRVNGAVLELNGTVFLQAIPGTAMFFNVLEGSATIDIGGITTTADVGNRVNVPIDAALAITGDAVAEEISLPAFNALPINLLDRQFILGNFDDELAGQPATTTDTTTSAAETTDSAPTGGFATPTPAGDLASSEVVSAPQTTQDCTLTTNGEVNIRSGPGTDYPAVSLANAGETYDVTGRNTDLSNIFWYQTERGWLRIDTITTSGSCEDAVPIVERPALPATATPAAPTGPSFVSSTLGDICSQGQVSSSVTSDGSATSVQLGGVYTVTAGTTVVFNTSGGQLRPEFGDYIQIQLEDGTRIAGSGEGRVLAVEFSDPGSFITRFSAGNGDVVVMSASCGSAG